MAISIADMIKKEMVKIEGSDEDKFSLELTAHWEDIIKQGGSE